MVMVGTDVGAGRLTVVGEDVMARVEMVGADVAVSGDVGLLRSVAIMGWVSGSVGEIVTGIGPVAVIFIPSTFIAGGGNSVLTFTGSFAQDQTATLSIAAARAIHFIVTPFIENESGQLPNS